jgi:hypothetical protein
MRINRMFIAASMLALGTLMTAVNIQAEEQNSHERDTRPDGRGDLIRDLPPRGGAASTGAVVTGNGINYHNGPVLHTVNLYYIWYGNWATSDPTGPAILNHFGNNIGGSPYFAINTSYGDTTGNVPNAVTLKGSYTDTGTLGTSLSDTNILTLVSNAINSGQLGTAGAADPNGLYMVLTAPGVKETSGFLTQYCGWHDWSTFNGTPIQFAFVGNAAGPSLSSCNGQLQNTASPNGDPGADAMVSVMAHELEETATDPQGTGWYDGSGNENGDKCAWNFGTTYSANGALANMTLGNANSGVKNYLIQQNWLNAQGGKCALSYSTTPDFSVSVSGSQTIAPGGTSNNYTLTETALNGFSGLVTWTFSNLPAGISVTPAANPLTGSPATFTLTAAGNVTPGPYTVTATGTSNSLTHSVTVNLVVSAPTFSLSMTPTSRTVSRPGSGTVSTTYTVNVNAVGAFTNPVTLSVSGGTTGVTPSITGTNPVTPGGTGTLSVTVSSSARRSTRTLTVTGSASGTTNKSTTATITIQ